MRASSLYLRQWLHLRLRKWLVHPVCRTLYRDRNHDVGTSMIVAGTGRSGTTWLAKIISSQQSCRVLFAPFHARYVDGFHAFHYFQYMRPDVENEPLRRFCETVFSGRIRHPWIDREVAVLRPQCRLIKEIRMNLFLNWVAQRFPAVPIVFVIRHPCAVVLSRMHLGWATDDDLAPFLAQDALVTDFLADKMHVIEAARTAEQKHALVWCISNLVPLRQFAGAAWHPVFYENLLLQPDKEIPRVFEAVGRLYGPSVFQALERPSSSTTATGAVMHGQHGVSQWKDKLTARQIDQVMDVVAAFGLDHLYDDAGIPGPQISIV